MRAVLDLQMKEINFSSQILSLCVNLFSGYATGYKKLSTPPPPPPIFPLENFKMASKTIKENERRTYVPTTQLLD